MPPDSDENTNPGPEPDAEGRFDQQLLFTLGDAVEPQPFRAITKRDGTEERFSTERIAGAIFEAAKSSGGEDYDHARSLAKAVSIYLGKRLGALTPTVDSVHDAVERVLIYMGHARTALAYSRRRDRDARIRRLRNGDLRVLMDELREASATGNGSNGAHGIHVTSRDGNGAAWKRNTLADYLMDRLDLEEPMAQLIALEVEQQLVRAKRATISAGEIRDLANARSQPLRMPWPSSSPSPP